MSMNVHSNKKLSTGSPRFEGQELQELARQQGDSAAWLALLQRAAPAEAARQVQGSFAVGLTRENGEVFLAVDRFAVESICYRVDDDGLHFASRADELGRAEDIDPQAIFDYLYFHVIPAPRTIYRNVFRLPAGHYAHYANGKLSIAPYWVPSFEPAREASFEQLRDEFRQTLRDAVATQLDGGKPGCFLSGGTDSSTVAGTVAQVSGRGAATYSIGFEAEGYDEMAYARIAAKHFKTEHHEYYVTPEDLVRSVPEVAGWYDQPFGNSSALPAFYCAKMAREDGVTKILAGDGGDELFGGNTRYAKQKVFGVYDNLPAHALLEGFAGQAWAQAVPGISKVASYINQAKVGMPARMHTYNLLERLGMDEVLGAGFLQRIDRAEPRRHQQATWDQLKSGDLVDRMLAYDWRYTLADCDLPKVCGTTRLAGLDVGFPMLDDHLLAFAARLPAGYKVRGLKLRWFFKEALRGFLPDEIITKKKQGFGLPFGVWAHRDAALQKLARESVEGLVERGIIRADFSQQLFSSYLPAHPGYYGEMIWISMMLEQWLRRHAPAYRI